MLLKLVKIVTYNVALDTVNSWYCGHARGLCLVSLIMAGSVIAGCKLNSALKVPLTPKVFLLNNKAYLVE